MRTIIVLIIIHLLLMLVACTEVKSTEMNKGDVLAKVYDNILFRSDLLPILHAGTSKNDSISETTDFIDRWIRSELLLHQAEINLPPTQLNIDWEMEEYKKNLLTFRYEAELVSQKLDTSVQESEIESYYAEHKDNFMLKDNIVKVNFLKIRLETKGLDKAKNWYTSENPKDQESLKNFCIRNADNFFLDWNVWLRLEDVMREIPLRNYNPEIFLKTTRKLELSDTAYNYFLFIHDFKIKEMPSPLSFEHENIRQLIINKRKIKLIEEMKNSIYDDARKNGSFKVMGK